VKSRYVVDTNVLIAASAVDSEELFPLPKRWKSIACQRCAQPNRTKRSQAGANLFYLADL
jgi:hypothetical protein